MSSSFPQEQRRRASNTEKVLAVFRAHPMRWLHWKRFATNTVGGECAWRTRISDARKHVQLEGGVIEHNGSVKRSAYRFLPHVPLGRSADVPKPDAWPAMDAPSREPWGLT